MIRNFIRKFFEIEIRDAAFEKVHKLREEDIERHYQAQCAELEYLVGKPVIVLTNQWVDPLIGKIVRLENFDKPYSVPLPVVFDELTQKEYLTFGTVCHYSDEAVRAIEKLTPSEAWVLVTKGRCGAFVPPENYNSSDPINQYRRLLARLPVDFGEEA